MYENGMQERLHINFGDIFQLFITNVIFNDLETESEQYIYMYDGSQEDENEAEMERENENGENLV
jgi:hypothetical protein